MSSVQSATPRDRIRFDDHPISIAINSLIHKARDIDACISEFVPAADNHRVAAAERLLEELKSLKDAGDVGQGAALRKVFDIVRRVNRVGSSNRAGTLRDSLFLGLFSAYDAFLGDLIGALFDARPELFHKLAGQLSIGDVLAAGSLDELKKGILADEIEQLRRKSYCEQFDSLEKLFDVKLRLFSNWSRFVEAGQFRNLVAHCSGVISEQYLTVCKREGAAELVGDRSAGQKIALDDEYISATSRLIAEVALRLGQTLWRKMLSQQLEAADKHLHAVAYEALQFEEWTWSSIVGEFALSQKKHSSEQNRLIALINHAIAVNFAGDREKTKELLAAEDWSSRSADFKLAEAVLNERYSEAGEIMVRIGQNGELVEDASYHDWPLFRDFRGTPEFLTAYESVFGRPFTADLETSVAKAEQVVESLDASPGKDASSSEN